LHTVPPSLCYLGYTLQRDDVAQDAFDEGSNPDQPAEVQPSDVVPVKV